MWSAGGVGTAGVRYRAGGMHYQSVDLVRRRETLRRPCPGLGMDSWGEQSAISDVRRAQSGPAAGGGKSAAGTTERLRAYRKLRAGRRAVGCFRAGKLS